MGYRVIISSLPFHFDWTCSFQSNFPRICFIPYICFSLLNESFFLSLSSLSNSFKITYSLILLFHSLILFSFCSLFKPFDVFFLLIFHFLFSFFFIHSFSLAWIIPFHNLTLRIPSFDLSSISFVLLFICLIKYI